MGNRDILVSHDNHFAIRGGKSSFQTTTFHLFLRGFNGRAHLTSPSLDWRGGDGEINIDGVVVRPRRGYGRAKDFYRSFFKNSLHAFIDIYRILKDYDAIVVAGPCCSAPYAHLAAWLQCKPVVGYVIGDNRAVVASSKEYSGLQRWFAKAVARWEWAAVERLAKRHQVIALGADLADSLSHYGENVSLGFTSLIREDQIVREKRFQPSGTLELLTVGRISQEKGIEWALRAIALLKQRGDLVRYTVVGEGPDLERLCLLVDELGIGSEVRFLGAKPYSELPNYYQLADIFILPSHTEGVAKVLLEAMAYRLPIVATKVGGTPWVLGDGNRGVLMTSGDANAIADAVIKYRDDVHFRERILSSATDFILQNTMEASARSIMKILPRD
jgi:glycosyltransferase involved in cell wall biosynthesis